MTKPRTDIHQEVTDRIIAALEAGTAPWQKEWLSGPKRHCGTDYQGINTLLLAMEQDARGFANPHWLTFKQAQTLGGCVRKGEKGTRIVFYKRLSVEAEEGDSRADENGQRQIGFLRYYTVFNVEQCDDLDMDRFTAGTAQLSDEMRDAWAEEALRSCGATIREGGGEAYYTETTDTVHMPDFAAFTSVSAYLATLAHELTHWTGPAHRLDRPMFADYAKGREFRAMEELVAEIGAAFICARLGIAGDHFESHASYVASWLKALKDDKRCIFKAAALAQQAADMVLENAPARPAGQPVEPVPAPACSSQLEADIAALTRAARWTGSEAPRSQTQFAF